MVGAVPGGPSFGPDVGPAGAMLGAGEDSWAFAAPRAAAGGQYQVPPWWWAAVAAERGAKAAASLGTGWGTSARQLLDAVASVPVSSWVLLLLALYLARHVRSLWHPPHQQHLSHPLMHVLQSRGNHHGRLDIRENVAHSSCSLHLRPHAVMMVQHDPLTLCTRPTIYDLGQKPPRFQAEHTASCTSSLPLEAQWYRRQQRVLLASQRARWEHEQATLAQFTVSESFTLGWLNVMLRHLWPTVIEKEVAEVAAANIRVRTAYRLVCTSLLAVWKHVSAWLLPAPNRVAARNAHRFYAY